MRTKSNTHYRRPFTPIVFIAFWLAIALPFLYVPLLVTGLVTHYMEAFLLLILLNLVALIIGHQYGDPRHESSDTDSLAPPD